MQKNKTSTFWQWLRAINTLRIGDRMLGLTLSGLLLFLFFLPLIIVIPLSLNASRFMSFPPQNYSLRWYKLFFSSSEWIGATLFSFAVATATMLLATIMGTMASIALVRGKFRGKNFLNGLFLLPMIVPLVVTATALFLFFSKVGLTDTYLGLVFAHTVLAIPFVVINVSAVLNGFDITLEQAAMNLGANPLQTFLKVTFPIIRPGIISGAAFAFIISWDEIVVAIFITGVRHYTLPRKMWENIRYAFDPTLAVVAVVLASISLIFIVISQVYQRKGGD